MSSQYQLGLSLIELMVSLLIGSVLTLGVANMYVQSKVNYFQDEQTYRMQEGARYAARLLSREISMSGYPLGVFDSSIIAVNSVANDCGAAGIDWILNPSNALEHTDNITAAISGDYSCISDSSIIETGSGGSDLLVVKRSADGPAYDDGELNPLATFLNTAHYFRVTNGGNYASIVKGSAVLPVDRIAGSGVDLWQYYARIFMIRNYAVDVGDGIPTLIVGSLEDDGIGPPEAYVEGIEKLNLEFGIDSDDDDIVDYFIGTPTAAEISDSITVRIHLLMRSIDAVTGYVNDKSYAMGSENVAAKNDGFLRRVYSTTVKIRNLTGR